MSSERRDIVRVRFAPSPTGPLHVGNAYVALFDYVFARASGGKFVLRIEDTDRTRSTRESEEAIVRGLKWLGLQWDEGPDIGGPFAPYRQSERCAIYREKAEELVQKERAYRCFCPPERLAALRQPAQGAKGPLGYDGACRRLARAEAESRAKAGEPHVIRLAVPRSGETCFTDVVRGLVRFQNDQIDDQVLLKSDGFPTYHLANVVDDHLMRITHVIRAEEWLSSTPKHILLYEAFGWQPPTFVHMPLLRNPDRSKLSKRKNPTSIDWYREQGYLPEALLNFLGLMGWSAPDGSEVFGLEKMIREFSWERVSKSAPIFDLQKLDWLNGVYIRAMEPERLAAALQSTVLAGRGVDDGFLLRMIPIIRERMKKLSDFFEVTDYIFQAEVSPKIEQLIPKNRSREETAAILRKARELLADVEPWTAAKMEERLQPCLAASGWKTRDFFMTLRVAVTGKSVSPPLLESMELLGPERTLARLDKAIALVERSG